MDADFSIELGREDPVLDFPWKDPAGTLFYFDLKRRPELMVSIAEVEMFPELGGFLRTVNSAQSVVESAKCDAWETADLCKEEEIYGASHKLGSYVDVVFSDIDSRLSLAVHEQFARKLVELLQRAPETPSAAEVCVRRCYFGVDSDVREGFYCTLYVSGYGNDNAGAGQNWGVALKLMGSAIVQLSAESKIERIQGKIPLRT
jgi:hypothetical protein